VTIETSSTTMNWATHAMARISRRGLITSAGCAGWALAVHRFSGANLDMRDVYMVDV